MKHESSKNPFELPRLLNKMRTENEAADEIDLSEAAMPTENLQEFIDQHVVSLPVIMHAFPRGNLDMRVLEGHPWFRLKKFFGYDEAKNILVKSETEIEFVQAALGMMEDWFYEGKWIECLHPPTRKEIHNLIKSRTSTNPKHRVVAPDLIKRVGREPEENLGLSGEKGMSGPLTDFVTAAQQSGNELSAYKSYAGNLFLGPAAVANTLSFMRLDKPQDVRPNLTKLRQLADSTSRYATQKYEEWGENVPKEPKYQQGKTLMENASSLLYLHQWGNRADFYQDSHNSFNRLMLFIKNVMIGAESIRRLDGGKLSKDGYFSLLQDMHKRQEAWDGQRKAAGQQTNEFPLFSFSQDPRFISASNLRANSKAFPFSLFVADYMREKHEKK